MNNFLIILALVIAIEVPGYGQSNDQVTAFDNYIRPYVESNNFSGTILISKDKQVLFRKAYGYANVESKILNQVNTAYHIASVSKTFTAAAILILEQRGLLTTDDL